MMSNFKLMLRFQELELLKSVTKDTFSFQNSRKDTGQAVSFLDSVQHRSLELIVMDVKILASIWTLNHPWVKQALAEREAEEKHQWKPEECQLVQVQQLHLQTSRIMNKLQMNQSLSMMMEIFGDHLWLTHQLSKLKMKTVKKKKTTLTLVTSKAWLISTRDHNS